MNNTDVYHIPVLLNESIEGMNLKANGIYADMTFGGGGHSKEILRRMGEDCHLYSFDQDEDAEKNIVDDKRFTFVRSNFRYLRNFMRYYGVEQLDGILADLGVSSHHFDDSERGFSFRFDGKLDMRMNKRAGMTAADIVNTYDEEKLADVFYIYGELKNSRKLAATIAKARQQKQITTIGEFLDIIKPLFGREREKKELAKVFQALRIEVNHEMEALKEMLYEATDLLKPGGRLVVITYHSLEDRMVKNLIKAGNIEGKVEQDFYGNVQSPFRAVNNKVIVPTDEEVNQNPRSRSAKLRIAEKRIRYNKELREMEQQNTEQNQNAAPQITLKSIFSGDILGHKFLKKQANLLILIVMLTILYIDNRYNSQQELIEIDKLKKELINAKYDALSVSSELTVRSRQSRIEEFITEENSAEPLQTAATPPFLIRKNN